MNQLRYRLAAWPQLVICSFPRWIIGMVPGVSVRCWWNPHLCLGHSLWSFFVQIGWRLTMLKSPDSFHKSPCLLVNFPALHWLNSLVPYFVFNILQIRIFFGLCSLHSMLDKKSIGWHIWFDLVVYMDLFLFCLQKSGNDWASLGITGHLAGWGRPFWRSRVATELWRGLIGQTRRMVEGTQCQSKPHIDSWKIDWFKGKSNGNWKQLFF